MIIHGDCLQEMATLPAESVDSIVTDPPYGLSFMGKDWDRGVPGEAFWREALRVAKPGAHLLAFGGSRTYHRLACAIEDAGWEVRDCIMYVFGSGFPKSHDVSKAIDRKAGAQPVDLGMSPNWRESKRDREKNGSMEVRGENAGRITTPATDAARQWQGWGTALKPAYEPIIVARKPLVGTVAANVQQYGTGAINVDGCRVEGVAQSFGNPTSSVTGHLIGKKPTGTWAPKPGYGRWPANFIHDGSDEVVGLFPMTTSGGGNGVRSELPNTCMSGKNYARVTTDGQPPSSGSAARFFYTAKASKRDRDEGCEGLPVKHVGTYAQDEWSRQNMGNTPDVQRKPIANHHPTVKPTDLMRYLCRLVTPPNGVVLDPFMGSGSTGKGAILEGFNFIGIEQNAEYIEIAKARIAFAQERAKQEPAKVNSPQTSLFDTDE